MGTIQKLKPRQYRSIWLSDIHLGYKGCKADYLLDFLKTTESDVLYLIGDIVDLWSVKRTMFWPQMHNNIVRTILGKAKQGTRVIYIPGNHDEQLREYTGMIFGNVEIHNEYTHVTPDGKRMLLVHGDAYDAIMKCRGVKNYIGNLGYEVLLYCNRQISRIRRKFGFPYWSLSGFVKRQVKDAMEHINNFAEVVCSDAARRGYDGVVCGHIHHADLREVEGILYCNDGDWVENCTALVELENGQMELIHWTEQQVTLNVNHINIASDPVAA